MKHAQGLYYSRHVYFDPEGGEYIALCTEFPHLSAFGETAAAALTELDVVLEGAIAVYEDEGWPLPSAVEPPEPAGLPSGKFVARLPKSLHAQLVVAARREGVSLNALVVSMLSAGVTRKAVLGEHREAHAEVVDVFRGILQSALQPQSVAPQRSAIVALGRSRVHESLWTMDSDSERDVGEWSGGSTQLHGVRLLTARIEG